MIHIISFSGGAASFCAAERIPLAPGDKLLLVFCDTRIEDEDLYRFIVDAPRVLGAELITLRDGRTPWDVFVDERFIGNTRIAPCSKILKRDLFRKWLEANYRPSECILYFGFDWTEGHRFERAKKVWEPYTIRAPLCDLPVLQKDAMFARLEARGLTVPGLYGLGFTHNNCGGFCVRAGQAQFEKLLRAAPDRYKWHEAKEQAVLAAIPTTRPFLRKTVNGVLNYISLKEFRESLERNNADFDPYAIGGCGCFSDDDDQPVGEPG